MALVARQRFAEVAVKNSLRRLRARVILPKKGLGARN